MLTVVTLTLLLQLEGVNSVSDSYITVPQEETGVSNSDSCEALKLEAIQIRLEGYDAMNRGYKAQHEALDLKREALDLKEEALQIRENSANSRSLLESRLVETLVDTFAFIKSQTTVSNLHVNEIKSTLSEVQDKINEMEEKFETLEEKFETLEQKVEQKFTDLQEQNSAIMNGLRDQGAALETQTAAIEGQTAAIEEQTTQTASMSEDVSRTLTATLTLKSRQQTILSEVRLISLYKPTGQTSTWAGPGHESELVSDGQYTFSGHDWAGMATYSQTGNNNPNNKIWLELGGWFKIHKVKVWNLRHCCTDRIVGSIVLADTKLIGTITQAESSYDFTVAEEDPTYARKVTLHQPLGQWLHILELQVWGSGPFPDQDKFA